MARARQVASGATFGTSLAVAFPAPVLAGSLLVYGHVGDVQWTSLTDTRNVPLLAIQTDATVFSAVHYVSNAVAGSTTVTRAFASGNAGLIVAEFINWGHFLTGAVEQLVGATGFSTTPSAGPVTCVWPAQLAIGFCGFENAGSPYNPQAAWQEEAETAAAGGTCELMTNYTTTGGTFTASGTTAATPNWSQNLVTFKLAPVSQPSYSSSPALIQKTLCRSQRGDELP